MPAKYYHRKFSPDVLDYELSQVAKRREQVHQLSPSKAANNSFDPHQVDLVGLAFSGGGIRSATFNLGILQALATLKLLTRVDYLSTVSGGGYIGGWLAAWARREKWVERTQVDKNGNVSSTNHAPIHNVQDQLDPSRIRQAEADRHFLKPKVPAEDEPEPIRHLRAYSRYLSPRLGIFSLDTWTLIALYFRHLLANGLLFLFTLLTLALFCRLGVLWFAVPLPSSIHCLSWALLVLIVLLLVYAQLMYRGFLGQIRSSSVLQQATPNVQASPRSSPKPNEAADKVFSQVAAPCIVAGFLALWLFGVDPNSDHSRLPEALRLSAAGSEPGPLIKPIEPSLNALGLIDRNSSFLNPFGEYLAYGIGIGVCSFLLHIIGETFIYTAAGSLSTGRRGWLGSALFGFVFGILFCAIVNNLAPPVGAGRTAPLCLAACLGVPLFLAALVGAGFLDAIVVGPSISEYEREWRGRMGAMLLLIAAAWAVVAAAVLYVPWLLFDPRSGFIAGLGWLASGAATYLLKWSPPKSDGKTSQYLVNRLTSLILLVAPPIFLVGLVALVSVLVQELNQVDGVGPHFVSRVEHGNFASACAWLAVAAGLGTTYAWLVQANLFSLHSVYGNRLVRCYLGASRRKECWVVDNSNDVPPGANSAGAPTGVDDNARVGNPFTGFGPRDDFSMLWLSADPDVLPRAGRVVQEPWKEARTPYSGPYPIFNATLNLVAATELAFQDRKGESFVLTPGFCGSRSTGYVRFADPQNVSPAEYRNLSLGRAMTISGAAVDPNMRNYQSAPLTFLLSLLNFRLGWWMQNPWSKGAGQRKDWKSESPSSASYLLNEALGNTSMSTDYVHLSDGGHFENTGAYELIRRRCRYVIVIDAAEDIADASENLANLIRLVRTDFGIPIEIDTTPLRVDENGQSQWHCAVGAIRYGEVDDKGVTGTLIFVRSSMTGDEPADIRNYAATHPAFPHNSTINQFFDEDEFESYRALGYHIGISVFASAKDGVDETPMDTEQDYRRYNRAYFAALRRAWAPLPKGGAEAYARSCRDYLQVVARLRDRTELRPISRSLFPEIDPDKVDSTGDAAKLQASNDKFTKVHEVDYLLQMMELSWLENELSRYHAHPLNRGWMNVMRRWTTSEVFQEHWPMLRAQYSRDFVRFCEVVLNLPVLPVLWWRLIPANVSAWEKSLLELDREFCAEWSASLQRLEPGVNPSKYISVVVEASKTNDKSALAWLLTVGQSTARSGPIESWPDGAIPLGVVVAFPPLTGKSKDAPWEMFVWIRGAYRTLGLGRESLPQLLPIIDAGLSEKKVQRLLVRFPRIGTTQGDRLLRAAWSWFFNDNDFVSEVEEGARTANELRLVRHISASNPGLQAKTTDEPAGGSAVRESSGVSPAGQEPQP
jgi:MFS family permease